MIEIEVTITFKQGGEIITQETGRDRISNEFGRRRLGYGTTRHVFEELYPQAETNLCEALKGLSQSTEHRIELPTPPTEAREAPE